MLNQIPQHVAIIMDGNGRWGQLHHRARSSGHEAGAENLERICEAASEAKVQYLTVFAFAKKNWKRGNEAQFLMRLTYQFFFRKAHTLIQKGVHVTFLGDLADSRLDTKLVELLRTLEYDSRHCTKLHLQVAFNYCGRDEIKRAQKADYDITCLYDSFFDAQYVPKVNLMIRTGVQNPVACCMRDSDFVPLAAADAVKVPSHLLWPDFAKQDLLDALTVYAAEDHLDGSTRMMGAAE